jgi:transcriptional regulator of arginine metabolism
LIQEIITIQAVETQEELSEILAVKGMPATQATISRDIKDLGLIKVPFQDSHRYAMPEDPGLGGGTRERLRRLLREVLTGYTVSENLVVVKTLTAGAEVVSEAIDKMDWPEVVGTLAGENTVLVVARSTEDAPLLAQRLDGLR